MAYRYTNTDKWDDAWFSALKPMEKLLFNYLCDNCDIAGFIEINKKRWSNDIGTDIRQIEGASKGLRRGLILAKTEDCFFIRNFLKHQKNLPINPNNKSHQGILRRFELYSYKFDIKDINKFIEGASKGLPSPTGNGNGNGIGNVLEEGVGETKTWRTDFETYRTELMKIYQELIIDSKYITEREKYHPGIDIGLSLEKVVNEFWGIEAGWIHKKKSRGLEINWKSTLTKSLDYKPNQVRIQYGKEKTNNTNIGADRGTRNTEPSGDYSPEKMRL